VRHLPDGAPWRSTIAAALKMSDHTFQRRLTSEGVVQQACRRNAARLVQHHLAYTRLSSSEIAYLVGYSDQSTFFRATHRWFGESPGEYPQRHGMRGRSLGRSASKASWVADYSFTFTVLELVRRHRRPT
jgi:AraC-like DNA-binding protein